jgi:S1-C subfamily serine protease
MNSRGSSFRSVFLSAFLGGLLVATLGFAAVSAGWVGKTERTTTTVATAAPVSNDADPNLVNQIYERDGAGVGFITASGAPAGSSGTDPFGQSEGGTATGSGFLIDKDGHIVTNNHVVEGARELTVKLGDSETSYSAELVGSDASTDLALLKIDAPGDQLRPLEIGDSDKLEVGDPVVAIGNPFGLNSTVTTGIVSALQREIQSTNGYSISEVIQTDAAINPGNSGGPLINTEGQVVGVNSQIATGGSGGGNVGIGFAVPSSTVKDVVSQIKDSGKVEHAYLGVSGATLNPEIIDALNLEVERGVLVQDLTSGGPADDAGIKGGDTPVTVGSQQVLSGGDVITAINGDEISTMEEVVAVINEAEVGVTVDVTVDRDGESRDFRVELGLRPDNASGNGSGQAPPQDSQQLPPGFGQ